MITWYKDKDAICNHVIKMEQQIENLQEEIEQFKNPRVLNLLPPLRGRRFVDVTVPEWVQFDNDTALLVDFKKYLQEAYACKRQP